MPVTDAELGGLLSWSLGRPVEVLERAPFAYASSVPMEELRVAGLPPLLLKDLTPRSRPSRPAFLVDPRREIEAYRSLLDGLDAPQLVGAVDDGEAAWMVLERVDGVPLWQVGDVTAWEAAARWLARLHQRPAPTGAQVLDHDVAHLRRWLQRAQALCPPGALDAIVPAAEAAIALLHRWPRSFLHGELYPSNVLVESIDGGWRVRAIDWETAGAGPGVLDLAALVSGSWPADRRARVVDAYRDALGVDAAALDAALDAARLVVALQWLGWSDAWAPPPEHAHDWLADAGALARKVAA